MRTYKLTVAYDGTAYQGWQRQANTERTIQGILESCISEQTGYEVEGRTDPAGQMPAYMRLGRRQVWCSAAGLKKIFLQAG